jgi:hypothetical protein
MLRKILNFGVVLSHAVYDLYKIIQLFYIYILHLINCLRTWCLVMN